MKATFLFSIYFFFLPSLSYAQIVINEVCSKNSAVIEDEFGDTSDWIELFNAGNSAINLEGYYLSDKVDNLTKWQFPNKTIAPDSFLLIFASGEDVVDIFCHTNFKLSSTGETLILSDENEVEIDRIAIPPLQEDHSYGKLIDGNNELSFFEIPTPKASNSNGSNYEFAAVPTFVTQKHFYENTTTIEIAPCMQPNCITRFTRDGNIPNENSEIYSAPINLDTTTCIRAVTFADDFYPSPTATQTYFINTHHSLPVMALASAPDNFWDWEEGIFQLGPNAEDTFPNLGANFWEDTQIPLHMEYYLNNNLEVEFDVSTRVHGGKAARTRPMKALRLLTDGEVPSTGLSYPFFYNKNINNFRRLVIRNASGDYNYTHCRDAYMQRYFIDEKLDLDVLAHQPMAVYINGVYWGVMNLREKIDRFYINENHGVDKDSIDLLEEDVIVIEGTADEYFSNYNFIVSNDLSIQSNFEIGASYFDISNLTDYFITQTYVNNTDFPNNNIKFWQPTTANGKWRYLFFDMDVSMGRHGWTKAKVDNFNPLLENPANNKFIYILLAFLKNKDFRNHFINRYADLMNTTFKVDKLIAETEKTEAEIDEEMKRHFEKWTWPGYDTWKNHRFAGLYDFIRDRPAFQREFVRQQFELPNEVNLTLRTYPHDAGEIKINTIIPDSLPWSGYYYNGVPVTLTIIPNNGFTFSHWESLYTILSKDASASITYNFEQDDAITAFFENEYDGLALNAFPNPIEENLQISFTLDQVSDINISLYNMTGQLLGSVNEGKRNGGLHTISLNISDLDLAKGIYLLTLETENFRETIKLFK